MRRVLLACLAAVLASGYAVTLGAADTQVGSLPDPKLLAKQILGSPAGHLMTGNAKLALEMAANGNQQMTQAPDPQSAASKAAATKLAQGGEGPGDARLSNVRVNSPGEDTHQNSQTTQSETAITAVGRNVAVAFNDSQTTLLALTAGSNLNGYAYSRDGGATFTDGGAPPNRPTCNNFGDPWLASDRTGAMYYSSLQNCITLNRFALDIGVAKSTDGGRTWSQPVDVSAGLGSFFYSGDKDAMAVGRDPSTASRDTIYVAWDDFVFDPLTFSQFNGLPVAHSNDGGATWSVVYADRIAQGALCPDGISRQFAQYIGAQPTVDPSNGALYVSALKIQQDCPSGGGKGGPPGPIVRSISVFKSTDGGNTFGPGTTVAVVTPAAPPFDMFNLGDGKFMRNLEFPTNAIVGASLYIAWNDGSATGPGAGHSHIVLAKSIDGGGTWTTRFVTGGTNDQMQPAMSGDSSGLHILYYQRNPNNTLDVKVSNSADGISFTARRVSSQSFPGVFNFPQFDPIINFFYMGDYIANISNGESQMFVWGDNRDIVRDFLFPSGRNDPNVYFATQPSEGDQNQQG